MKCAAFEGVLTEDLKEYGHLLEDVGDFPVLHAVLYPDDIVG